jgi:DNA-binding NarL/FixJ family response regulator
MATRVIVADADPIFRAGVVHVLGAEKDVEVVAQCGDAASALAQVKRHPGVVLVLSAVLDDDLQQVCAEVERSGGHLVVLLERGQSAPAELAACAHGVLSRGADAADLLHCLRLVTSGQRCVISPTASAVDEQDAVGERVLQRLTPKELEILALAAEGKQNKEIAVLQRTTQQTIKNHLMHVYDKTGVSDRLELALFVEHHKALAEAAVKTRAAMRKRKN